MKILLVFWTMRIDSQISIITCHCCKLKKINQSFIYLINIFSYILLDTPGQIEIFTWSASGSIISESFALTYPTIITYVIDTPRTIDPNTFMSNMLYCCSILYKFKLPFIIVFNKTDIQDEEFAKTWMKDFESFQNSFNVIFALNICFIHATEES